MEKKSSLFQKIYRQVMYKVLDSNAWYRILKYTIPFIRLTTYYPQLKKDLIFVELYRNLEPADILFQVDDKKLTTIGIGGEWSHVGICVGKGEGKVEIVDMTHIGFRKIDFFTFCKESTRIAIGRIKDDRWDKEYKELFLSMVWLEEGSEYNFTFRAKEKHDPRKHGPTNKDGVKVHKFNYCSQLPMVADIDDIIDANWEDLAGLGVPYISPTGLYKAKNLEVIIDTGK